MLTYSPPQTPQCHTLSASALKRSSPAQPRPIQLLCHTQRGAILVQFALLVFILFTILGTVQIGYMYYAKRDLQRVADVAAIEAVNAITFADPATCGTGQTAAQLSVTQQLRVGLDATAHDFVCGYWDPSQDDAQRFSATYSDDEDSNPLNAIEVTLRGQTLRLLPFTGTPMIEARAIATKKGQSIAAFSVGAQLLRFNENSPLGILLSAVGLNLDDLRVLDSDGLASATITPAGLLDLLGVDLGISDVGLLTPDGVADIRNITLLNIVDASISAVTDSTLAADLDVLRAHLLDIGLGYIEIPLGSDTNSGGLFAFLSTGRNDPLGNAMNVELGLADLLRTAIAIGNGANAVEIPELHIAGLITAKASIVEPPTIAVGPVGTTAYSAQIRVLLDIDTRNLLGGLVNTLVEGLLGIRVYLPLAIDVTAAQARLEAIQCTSMPPTIDLSIDSRILNACVGSIPASSAMSERHGCEVGLGEVPLIKLLHAPVLSGKLHVPGLAYKDLERGLDMEVGEVRSSLHNQLEIGSTAENLVVELLNLLSGLFRKPAPSPYFEGSFDNSALIDQLVETYLNMPELAPVIKDNAGFYNVAGITSLMLNGATIVRDGEQIRIDPLVSNFSFNNAIPTTCVLFVCPPSSWNPGTFSQAFNAYSNTPYSLLDVVGIPTLGNGFQSCAGLLSSLLNRNNCIEHNLKELFSQHKNQVGLNTSTINNIVNQIMNPETDEVQCNGALCMLVKPVLSLLKPILNGVGSLLSNTLAHALGLELGRSDVEALGIQCDVAEIVY